MFHSIGTDDSKESFTVTHPDMTRFFLTLEDGVNLIEKAMNDGQNGDTFIPKVESFRIMDIANLFVKLYKKPIKITGIRPGEKLHECLINESERFRTIQSDDSTCYVIKPCYNNIEADVDFTTEYTSDLIVSNIDIFERKYFNIR